jgi:hypothetical protein
MIEIVRRLHLALALVALVPAIAAAQEFNPDKIRPGQTVLVRDLTGAETKGVVQRVEQGKLVVKYGVGRFQDPVDPAKPLTDTRTFVPAEVDRVRRPGPIWDGAVKGALAAGVPAWIMGANDCYRCGGIIATIAAIGAGIGVGIDAAWGPKTVYRNRGPVRKVTVVPVIDRGRRGIAASIRF